MGRHMDELMKVLAAFVELGRVNNVTEIKVDGYTNDQLRMYAEMLCEEKYLEALEWDGDDVEEVVAFRPTIHALKALDSIE